MKTFKQFLKEKPYNEQLDMPPPQKIILGVPDMKLGITSLNKFKGIDDIIANSKDAEDILISLKFRTSKDKISKVNPETLANALVKTKAIPDKVKEILEYFGEHHNVMSKYEIKNMLNITFGNLDIPQDVKSYLTTKLEDFRQKHQQTRDIFYKKNYPDLLKGTNIDTSYYDSETGKGKFGEPDYLR